VKGFAAAAQAGARSRPVGSRSDAQRSSPGERDASTPHWRPTAPALGASRPRDAFISRDTLREAAEEEGVATPALIPAVAALWDSARPHAAHVRQSPTPQPPVLFAALVRLRFDSSTVQPLAGKRYAGRNAARRRIG